MDKQMRIAGIGANLSDIGADLDKVRAQVDELATMGADCAELYLSRLGIVAAARPIPTRLADLKRLCAERAMTFTIHAPIPINLMDCDNIGLHRRAARVSIDVAAEIGAPIVVIHAGRAHPDRWAREAGALLEFERIELAALGDHCRGTGVRIALENISPNQAVIGGRETSYSLDPAELALQLAALDHDCVTGCLDYSHANQGAGLLGFDLVDSVRAMAPYTGHIHISDTTGEPTLPGLGDKDYMIFFGVGDMHAPLGTSGIDFDALADVSPVLPGTVAILELQKMARPLLADSIARLAAFAGRVNALPAAVAA